MNSNSLRVRLRHRQDRDIRKALEQMELEQGELSDIIRLGVRKVLIERGILTYGNGHYEVAKANHESLGGLQLELFPVGQGNG